MTNGLVIFQNEREAPIFAYNIISMYDVIVIGAGASGLMYASRTARRGPSVLAIDHNAAPGSKLRATGGGRCNFSNLDMSPDHFASSNPHFVKSALKRFTPEDFIALLDARGIAWEEREHGRLFCKGSAIALTNMLYEDAISADVRFSFGTKVLGARKHDDSFIVETARHGSLTARSLVIASGGLSYESLGASPIGLDIARSFGLDIVPPRPALVPFTLTKQDRSLWGELSGLSHTVRITCSGGQEVLDDMLITHRGFSGPAGLRASLWWMPGTQVVIDFLPALDIYEMLMSHRKGRKELKTALACHMPQRLAELLARSCALQRPLCEISDREMRATAERLSHWEIVPAGTEGWDKAEVTRGGLSTEALSSKDMSARAVPGLFFIGEVMDVTGDLGGYNLHWAWASAHAAAAVHA